MAGGGSAGLGGSGAGSAGRGFPGGSSGQVGGGQFPGGSGGGQAGTGQAGTGGFPGGFGGRGFGGFGGRGFPGGGLGGNTQVAAALTRVLKRGAAGYRWTAATVGAESAAPLQLASGEPVMAIGGFNGTDSAPTLAGFERLVAAGEIHYFVGANQASFGGGSGPAAQITAWVRAHFSAETVGGVTVYDLASQATDI